MLCNRARISVEIWVAVTNVTLDYLKCMHNRTMKPQTSNCIDFHVIIGLIVCNDQVIRRRSCGLFLSVAWKQYFVVRIRPQ